MMQQQRINEHDTSMGGYPSSQASVPYTGSTYAYTAAKKPYKPPMFLQNAISFFAMMVGTILFFAAFGGPAWYVVPEDQAVLPKTFGLWQLCVREQCVVEMSNDYMVKKYLVEYPRVIPAFENFLVPVRVLMCIGLISVVLTVAFNLAFIAGFPTFFLEFALQLLTGVLVAISVGIFGGKFRDEFNTAPFGWAYWVAVVSAMVFIVNGIVMALISIMVFRQRRYSFFRRH